MAPAVLDAVVVGGGPAGTAAAATMARSGLRVRLLDRPAEGSFRVGEGAPPGLVDLVQDIFGDGVEAFVAADHLPSYGTRGSWGDEQPVEQDYLFHPRGHGWHLDRGAFDRRLRAATSALGVELVEDEAGSDSRWPAPWLIDATGRPARLARARGATRQVLDRQVAVVAFFECQAEDDDAATVVEARSDGWWYTAAVPDRGRVVAFLTDADLLAAERRTPGGFLHAVGRTTAIAGCIERSSAVLRDRPRVVAADTATLEPLGSPGWLATGDAAVSFDPVSSQGIITALELGRQAGLIVVGTDEPVDAAIASYTRLRDDLLTEHLTVRRSHHLDEQRWPDHPFWRRRHAPDPSSFGA